MIKYHSIVLFVKNIEKAKYFYCELLKIPIEMDMGKNVILRPGITLWEISDDNIIATTIGKEKITNGNKSELCFETDDIEGIQKLIDANSIKLLHGVHEEPWGQRTIRFFDFDSNIVEIGEKLSIFLKRLIKSGLNIDQLCNKTGMKIEDIEGCVGVKLADHKVFRN
jgi:catechol 2,3-dioxygenase-like lactoylglutathione lyase family enzyme